MPANCASSVVEFSSRRPKTALAVALLVLGIGVGLLSRARIDSTLSGMLGGDNAAAEALARLTDDFHTAEDILVLVSAPASVPVAESERLLLDYAGRLATAAQDGTPANAGITGVRYAPDPAFERYFRETVLPAGLLWLDDESLGAFMRRLGPDEVREQLAQNAAMLAAPGPGAGALAKQLVQDPLRLREFFLARFAQGFGNLQGATFSDDRHALLIRISGARPVNDLEFTKQFTATVRELADRANLTGLDIHIGGGYAVAATTASAIRRDAISSTIGSVTFILLFLAVAYRRILAPLTIMTTAGVGVVVAFSVYTLFIPTISPLTAVLAAMLAGLGVDYAIHFRSTHDAIQSAGCSSAHASIQTARELSGPMTGACLTSVFGFGAIALSEVRMLRDFAVLGCIGLVGALVAVWAVLPALLAISHPHAREASPAPRRSVASALLRWTTDRPARSVGAGAGIGLAAAVAIAATPGFAPPFESDPTVMHPRPNAALETGEMIRGRFRTLGESLFVRVVGGSPEELAARSHDITNRLATAEGRSAGVLGTLGLASLVADPRSTPGRLEELRALDTDAILAGVVHEFEQSEFDPAAFQDYFDFLRTLLTNSAVPGVEDVLTHPEVARQFLPAASVDDPRVLPGQAVVLVRATNAASERAARASLIESVRSLIADVPGTTLTGLVVVSNDLEKAARRDLFLFGWAASTLVAAWLFVLLRRPSRVLLAAIPVVFSVLCIFGIMSALGESLNAVNIVAFPLLIGIAVDSGIFLVAVADRSRRDGADLGQSLQPTAHAIMCTSGTTALGFGTLIWTHTPAVRSLGLAMLLGTGASLVACLLILAPLLVRRNARPQRSPP